ncbi:MAG: hypothetical protein IKA83_00525 [Paludibacteraceae bacterium]|nr:hypothetical protein [Paludibacteraceae bacterium]
MAYIDDLREQRKASLIVVCTLGMAALFMKDIQPIWMTNLFEGMSFAQGIMGLFFKVLSFFMLGFVIAAIFFIIHLVKVIVYSIDISRNS